MVVAAPKTQQMNRGTEAMKTHLANTSVMEIRETRRGWLMECLCPCSAKNEMKYFIDNQQVAVSTEDSDCCCRCLCPATVPFSMKVEELQTKSELLTVNRPFVCCTASPCKCCCCYQQASFKSGSDDLGQIKETCYVCIPEYTVYDSKGDKMYKIRPPSCCGGLCVNYLTEGTQCTSICCKVPYWIFDPNQSDTNGKNAVRLGKILKKPKSLAVEAFSDANAFEVTFPKEATPEQKASLLGSAIFFNAVYFEDTGSGMPPCCQIAKACS
jgi:hypothetical protein